MLKVLMVRNKSGTLGLATSKLDYDSDATESFNSNVFFQVMEKKKVAEEMR